MSTYETHLPNDTINNTATTPQATTTMPFQQVFEKHVNTNMTGDVEQLKQRSPTTEKSPHTSDLEAEDEEMHEKKDKPPRFSTLFGGAPAPQTFDSYPQPKRKSGVYLPMPLFVALMVALLFMGTMLFAYTVIGLYNNLPFKLVGTNGPACNCEAQDRQPAINISPNFVMPQAQAPVTVTVTSPGAGALSELLPSSTSTTSSSSSGTSTTSTINPSSDAAAIASNLMSMMSTLTTSTTSSITSSSSTTSSFTLIPGAATSTLILSEVLQRSTVSSIKLITVDASGSTLPPGPTPTSTIIDAAAESSIHAAMSSISNALIPSPILATTATPADTSVISSAVATAVVTATPSTATAVATVTSTPTIVSSNPDGITIVPVTTPPAPEATTTEDLTKTEHGCWNTMGPQLLSCLNPKE